MSKEQLVSDAKAALIAAQDSALTSVMNDLFDKAQAEVPQGGSGGGFTQADIDKAVSDAKAMDAQALADAQAKFDSDLAAANKALSDMTAKEQLEEQAVADVKAKIDQVQASFDAIKALFNPPAL